MKWNSMLQNDPQYPGGYAEARYPDSVVEYVDGNETFKSKYPYPIIGCFGKGWDDFETMTDEFVSIARDKTNSTRQVIVSNEEDFFDDFEANFGSTIPSLSESYGNEWDLYCAALAETSASIKRSVEKLRVAEAIATLTVLEDLAFMDGRQDVRDQAWMDLGLYWEHNFGMFNSPDNLVKERIAWQKRLEKEIASYVNALLHDGASALGKLIKKNGTNICFYVFNPLSWVRSDYADFPYVDQNPIHVVDKATGAEVASQFVLLDGKKYLRVFASEIPAMGYKVFEIQPGAGLEFAGAVSRQGNILENQYYQVSVAENGAITSWKDKIRNNRELVKSIDGLTVNDLGVGAGSIQIENEGAVSVTLLVTVSEPLKRTCRITLVRDSARMEIRNVINQNFDSVQSWAFGFDLTDPNVWHEEVGVIINAKLTTDGGHYSPRELNSRYDWLTLNHFADMSDETIGVTLSNADCYFMRLGKSSVSELDIHTPQISVLAGGRVVIEYTGLPNQGGDELFLQRFALSAHGVYDPVFAMRFALEHQNPFVVGEVKGGADYSADFYSFLEIDNPNVLLWVIKPADDGIDAGIVIRLWNVSQDKQDFSIRFDGRIKNVLHLSHIETPFGDLLIENNALFDSLNAQQIKTYAVFLERPSEDAPKFPVLSSVIPTSVNPIATTPVITNNNVVTPSPISTSITPVMTPATPDGKGCLWNLLSILSGLIK